MKRLQCFLFLFQAGLFSSLNADAQTRTAAVGQGKPEAAPCETLLYELIRSSNYPHIRRLHYWLFNASDSSVSVRLTKQADGWFAGNKHYPYVGTLKIDLRNRRIQDVTAALLEEGAAQVYVRCDTAIFDRLCATCLLPAE